MKTLARWAEILLLWLSPAAWMIFCAIQFKDWEPTPEYTNAGAFLILATLWLFEFGVIKKALPDRRAKVWGMVAAFCFTALLSGVLFFIIIPANWAGIWILILTIMAMALTMPEKAKTPAAVDAAGPPATLKPGGDSGRASVAIMIVVVLIIIGGVGFYFLGGARGSLKRQQLRAFFGSVDDQVSLAWRYREGQDLPQDFSKAAVWFEKAANGGSAKAQYDIGVLTYYGLGTGESSAKAREWFEKAARQDYAPAITMLGLIAQDERDTPKAIQLWQRAVSLNDFWAEYLLGTAYLSLQSASKNPNAREKNLILALFWLEKARRDGAEPIGGMLRHVWSTVPPESMDRVTDEVFRGLKEGVAP